jgi:hypothetical protein
MLTVWMPIGPFGGSTDFGEWPGLVGFQARGNIVAFGGSTDSSMNFTHFPLIRDFTGSNKRSSLTAMLTSLSFITDGKPPELELEILDEDAWKYNLAPLRAISLPKIEYEPRTSSSVKFTGRGDYLTKLRDYFIVKPDEPLYRKFLLLYGMKGIGKTQICLKFTEENSDL